VYSSSTRQPREDSNGDFNWIMIPIGFALQSCMCNI
jgi:hypothetical protein